MKPKLVLFDLGRVLADLGSPSNRMRLPISDDEFWDILLVLPILGSRAFSLDEVASRFSDVLSLYAEDESST